MNYHLGFSLIFLLISSGLCQERIFFPDEVESRSFGRDRHSQKDLVNHGSGGLYVYDEVPQYQPGSVNPTIRQPVVSEYLQPPRSDAARSFQSGPSPWINPSLNELNNPYYGNSNANSNANSHRNHYPGYNRDGASSASSAASASSAIVNGVPVAAASAGAANANKYGSGSSTSTSTATGARPQQFYPAQYWPNIHGRSGGEENEDDAAKSADDSKSLPMTSANATTLIFSSK